MSEQTEVETTKEGGEHSAEGAIGQRPEAGAEQQQHDDTPEPILKLASEMGWKPKDQYDGPEDGWKPATEWLRAGRDIQRDYRTTIRNLEHQMGTIAKTSASIVEAQVQERVAELTDRYNQAVEDGKPKEAFELAKEITTISTKPAGPSGPSPEAQAFAERNGSWFDKPGHEDATSRAFEICSMLAAQGYTDHGTQLRIAEQRMRREYPELFKDGMNGVRKEPPGVNTPGSRAPAPSNRQKGFADLPKEAQDIARDMVDRKVINSTDDYVRNYFANEAGKA